MAPPCHGRRRTLACLTALTAFGLLGASVYLFIEIQDLVAALSIVSVLLVRLDQTLVAGLPTGALAVAQRLTPYLDFLSMGPAVISMVLLLGAAAAAVGRQGQRSFCCAKLFVALAELALLVALTWYLGVTSAALMADRPVLTEQWAAFTAVCVEEKPLLQQAVSEAQQSVDTLGASGTPGATASAQAALAAAQAQMTDFDELCTALDDVPSQVLRLRGAGLASLVATLLALLAVNSLCCAAGCCCRVRAARVAPEPAPAPSKPTGHADEEPLDEEDLVAP